MATLFLVSAFALGLLLGSFLNVCIARLPQHESIVSPRSRCGSCGREIRWYDNVPLLSYVVLAGKCRDCGSRISLVYPAVELATGIWFALAVYLGAGALQIATLWVAGFLLIGLAVMDWQTHLLPDGFTLTGILLGMMLICTRTIFLGPHEGDVLLAKHHIELRAPGATHDGGNIFLTGSESLIFGRLAAVVGAFLLLFAIRALYKLVRKRDGMGLGDAKLLAMIAAFLGFAPALFALFVGVCGATFYAVLLLMRGKASGATRLPFGSFLAVGGMVSALYGEAVVAWYTSLFR
ncbi:prepilin peptidase [Terriglobus saanensis]|uniref:Prepilin peptidase n=1 Tax=Terriglobus saanensis (strain ATCC BAA-1853 / DSM 23119 / SP1PR4) TaxID=401053 RepID=E8UZH4_TERSS|nr:A24 family peptidase [Terriglobus saanensis]ADV83254.1 Prepilin peptidase [Terriglobus saanensis SP1PR4]